MAKIGRNRCYSRTVWRDYVRDVNPVRVVKDFIDELDLTEIFEPAAGTGSSASYRVDVADRAAGARLQDYCRHPQGEWCGDPVSVPSVCRAYVLDTQNLHR